MSDLRTELERAGRQAPQLQDDPLEHLRSRRARKALRGRVAAGAVSLTVVVVAIGGLWTAFHPHNAPSTPVRTLAGPSVDLTVPPNEYSFVQQDWYGPGNGGGDGSGTKWQDQYATTTWYRADDSGRIISVQNGQRSDQSYDPGNFLQDTGDLTYLSTDPTQLLAQMTDRMQPGGRSPEPFDQFTPGPGQDGHETAGLVRSIGELLNDPNSEPALKAALFQVASGLQGMDVQQNVTDPTGRPATMLRIETEQVVHEWWFDPSSEQLLAMETLDPGSGNVTSVMVVGASGVAATTDDGGQLNPSFIPAPVHDPAKP
jgi:hypothetical protein